MPLKQINQPNQVNWNNDKKFHAIQLVMQEIWFKKKFFFFFITATSLSR